MSDDKKGWTPKHVRKHLKNAVYLEMWTIPLYLTAAYSIKVPLNPNTTELPLIDGAAAYPGVTYVQALHAA